MADARDDVNTIESEDGTTWVEIASVGTEDEANLLRGFLEAEGIRSKEGIPLIRPVVDDLLDISRKTGIPFELK